ncbi:MAG: hypothetical protein KatS3mg129_0238 [Leptospiraceae bacterium]|nr:MAG: hypothetical protein KatS3mg129_0238 [Leptospiraceae bacterium]
MKKSKNHPTLVELMNYQLGICYKKEVILHLKKCKTCLNKIKNLEKEILLTRLEKANYSFYYEKSPEGGK